MRRLRRPAGATTIAVTMLACLAGGCRPGTEAPAARGYDLVSRLELARVRSETGVIDLGTPEAREFLHEGWSWDEAGDATFVWGVGRRSTARFFLTGARDLSVGLRVAGEPGPAGEAQTVAVRVNGEAIDELTLTPDLEEYRLTLPADVLRPDWNRLALRYRHRRDGPRIRQLAARWDRIRFGEIERSGGRVRAGAGKSLSLPLGTQVEYTLRLPGSAVLEIEELAANGAPGRLQVLLAGEGREEAELGTLAPGNKLRIELGEAARGVSHLTLRAVRRGGAGGLLMGRPRVALGDTGDDPPPPTPRSNVIVYLIDALRADRVGVYGGPPGLTPSIDRFAGEAVVYRNAIAQSSWTKPAVASLFTGLLPPSHAVLLRRHALSPRATTLAETLLASGYRTAAFSTNPFVSRSYGLDQGFLDFVYLNAGRVGTHHALSDRVHREVVKWLDREPQEPFFLYVHTIDAHAPYTPRRPDGTLGTGEEPRPVASCKEQQPLSETARRRLAGRYDEEVAFNDASFGRLLEELRERDLYDDSLIVLLSDHGEAFWEHRSWHHENFLYSEVIDIPLILKPPGEPRGGAGEGLAQQIDVLPTILDGLGLPVPSGVEGRSLLTADGRDRPRPGFAFLECPSGKRFEAVLAGPWKLIRTTGPEGAAPRLELFHRRHDPGELEDLAAVEPQVVERLHRLLESRAVGRPLAAERVEVGEELQESLRALGYVD